MTRRERFLRVYSEADWFAHLLLSTCAMAAINFVEILAQALGRDIGTRTVDGFEITVCYFGPPAAFYPRLFVLGALLIATPATFKKTACSRLVASVGSLVALASYTLWWAASYSRFRNYEVLAGIYAFSHPGVRQFAYLYEGTPLDLAVALSTTVCLVLLLDRLFDGEKKREQ